MYKKFKFHYDSINSTIAAKMLQYNKAFKFHYDSINSAIGPLSIGFGKDLNSIMILLIPLRKLQDSLIPIFKFHYDSINSGGTV